MFFRKYIVGMAVLLMSSSPVLASVADDMRKAVEMDSAFAVRQLLAKGADPNVTTTKGAPVLVSALQENALAAARELLKSPKLDPDALNPAGENALMIAALKGHIDIVKTLVEKHQAEVNKAGWAPLHYAATSGQEEITRYLLDNSAYVDAESPNLTTPLMMAARSGNIRVVKLLLDEGAVLTLKNQKHMNAIDFAKQFGHQEIADGLTSRLRKLQSVSPPRW
jgi:ankyrin repeat protein